MAFKILETIVSKKKKTPSNWRFCSFFSICSLVSIITGHILLSRDGASLQNLMFFDKARYEFTGFDSGIFGKK